MTKHVQVVYDSDLGEIECTFVKDEDGMTLLTAFIGLFDVTTLVEDARVTYDKLIDLAWDEYYG